MIPKIFKIHNNVAKIKLRQKKNDVYTILNFESFYIFTKVKDSVEVSEL